MKLLFKLVFGLGVLIVLAIGALAITLVYLDPNDYKGVIADKVKEKTGRDLSIDGKISLSYYPWLGLDVEGVSISNAKGFGDAPFLKTKHVKARAKLLPLLRKELEMDTLILHGATVNLAKNKEGVTNWDDLITPQAEKSDQAMPLAALVLGGIDIKDANIHWRDMQQGVEYKITNANINTGELKFGDPIDIVATLNVSASKPALSSAIQFNGTVAYEDNGDVLTLKPMLLEANVKGKEVPGGTALVKLSSEINLDLDKGTAEINALDLTAFDTQVKGQLKALEIRSAKPEVSGDIDVKGKDLAQLFKIFEIEPLASQLATMSDKTFSINSTFNLDTNRSDVDIKKLTMNVLGNSVNAEIYARNLESKTPAAKGKLVAKGPNLPVLIKIAGQFMGDAASLSSLSKQLESAPKDFSIASGFDVDLKTGLAEIPTLSINALGMKTIGKLNGKNLDSDSPAISGDLKASGSNLPLILSIATQLSGDTKKSNAALLNQLETAPKNFSIEADFGSDIKSGGIDIPKLSINALGTTTNGKLKIKNIKSETPAISGDLKASGSNLPLLMLIAGSTQPKDNGLSSLAKDLAKLNDKAFTIDSKFDLDQKSGKIELPALSVNAFGVQLAGNIKGSNKGKLEGKMVLNSKTPKPVLTALGQADIAEVLSSFNINTNINGDASKLNLKPFSFDAVFAGKNIPNSPVTLKVQADSEVNLDKEVFDLRGLQISGLGLDVKGAVKAEQFKTAPKFSGQLSVAPFNLKSFMQTLNKELPKTADPEVFKRLAFSGDIAGSPGSLSLKNIKAELDESKLQGSMNVIALSPLNLEFGLGIDKLNVDRYLPPETKDKKVVATPEAVAAGVATEIPTDTLQAIKIKGDLAVGQFVISGARLSDIEFSIRADKGDIKLNPIAAKLYSGSYAGDIHLDATGKEPKLVMNTKLTGVQTEPLLKDVTGSADVSGIANIGLALNSSGANTDLLKRRLSGKGDIKFTEGIFRGVDIPKVLKQVEIMYESKRPGVIDKEGQTNFDSLTATMDIHNGVVDNKDMLMLAPGFKVKGEGMMVNLNDETWKYNMTVIVDPSSATKGTERYNIGGYDLLIKCRGKVIEKKCLPDVESMINALFKDTAKKEIQKKLEDVIGIKLPGSKSEQPAPQETQPAQEPVQKTEPTTEQQVQPKDPVKEVQDKVINDIFDKLF
jgi:AsmA protein